MEAMITAWRESGESKVQFCKEQGIARSMQRQATSGEVFVFLNRTRMHMKLLHWEHGGFVLYYKRLEQGAFPVSKGAVVNFPGAI